MEGEKVSVTTGSRIEATSEALYRLNAQRMTVLTLLLTLGVSTALTLGFGVGGWWGVGAGLAAGSGCPSARC